MVCRVSWLNGFWYVAAQDDEAIKQFKLIRIQGDFALVGKKNSFSKPEGFDLKAFIETSSKAEEVTAQILVRKNQALSLRNQFAVTEIDDEWDQMQIVFHNQDELVERVLWYLDSIKVISPNELRNEVLIRLKAFVNGWLSI